VQVALPLSKSGEVGEQLKRFSGDLKVTKGANRSGTRKRSSLPETWL